MASLKDNFFKKWSNILQKIFKLPSWELASLQFLPIAMNNGNAVFFLYVKHKDECKNNCGKNSEKILSANKKNVWILGSEFVK